ncbi:MAG: hypothetical protein IT372_35060 [Polyangiaceae bacterium]|nr:hypothetical protein [Polyangiaceae bacterium]
MLLEGVRAAHDRPIPALDGLSGEAALVFVDLAPDASWSHPCANVVFPAGGEPVWADHRWPPAEDIRLVPISRLPGT